jgi:hypothetical protein
MGGVQGLECIMIAKADGLTAPRRAWPLVQSQLCHCAVTPWQGNPGSGINRGYVESNRIAFLSHRPGTAVTCRRPAAPSCSHPSACIDTTRFPPMSEIRHRSGVVCSCRALTEARRHRLRPDANDAQAARQPRRQVRGDGINLARNVPHKRGGTIILFTESKPRHGDAVRGSGSHELLHDLTSLSRTDSTVRSQSGSPHRAHRLDGRRRLSGQCQTICAFPVRFPSFFIFTFSHISLVPV